LLLILKSIVSEGISEGMLDLAEPEIKRDRERDRESQRERQIGRQMIIEGKSGMRSSTDLWDKEDWFHFRPIKD
jgi:hypothetical protein